MTPVDLPAELEHLTEQANRNRIFYQLRFPLNGCEIVITVKPKLTDEHGHAD